MDTRGRPWLAAPRNESAIGLLQQPHGKKMQRQRRRHAQLHVKPSLISSDGCVQPALDHHLELLVPCIAGECAALAQVIKEVLKPALHCSAEYVAQRLKYILIALQ